MGRKVSNPTFNKQGQITGAQTQQTQNVFPTTGEGDRATSPIIPQGEVINKPNISQTSPTSTPTVNQTITQTPTGVQTATSYKDNGDGTFTQYFSDGTTGTTNQRPITGNEQGSTESMLQRDAQGKQLDNAYNQQLIGDRSIMQYGLETPTADKVEKGGIASLDKDIKDYQSAAAQLQSTIDLQKQKKQADLETLRINVTSQIDDVQRTAERNFAIAERAGAMSGAAMSSGFTQGLQNIKDDASRTINKLNNLYNIASNLTGLAADKAIDDYERALADAKRQFEYDHRDIMQGANYDLNQILKNVEGMGIKFDPEKVNASLGALAIKIQNARAESIGKYLDNANKITRDINDRIDGSMAMVQMQNLKSSQITARLDANNGEAILGLNQGQLDDYVTQGIMTPAMAAGYKAAGLQKAFNTLTSYAGTRTYDGKIIQPGQVSQADLQQLQNYINQGMTYSAAANKIIADNPDKYANEPVITPMEKTQIATAQQGITESQAKTQQALLDAAIKQQQYDVTQQIAIGNEIVDNISSPSAQEAVYKYSTTQRNDTTLQCGELVNDYIKMVTGKKGGMGNTYETKVKAIGDIGKSSVPQVGGVFATKFGETGHTGIVTGVNPDGSVTVYDANFVGFDKDKGAIPVSRTIPANEVKNMVFSKPINAANDIKGILKNKIKLLGLTDIATQNMSQGVDSARNTAEMTEAAKQIAKKAMGATLEAKLTNYETVAENLKTIQREYNAVKDSGKGKTGITEGAMQRVYNLFGLTGDKDLVNLDTQTQLAIQAYRNAISGTAYSDQERKEINKVFPGISKTEDLNKAILDASIKYYNKQIDSSYVAQLGDVYNKLKGDETQQSSSGNGRRANANK